MPQWSDLSRESFLAARHAMGHSCHRSSVSRSYYAAYAAVAQALTDSGVTFVAEREGPSHQSVRDMIESNIGRLKGRQKKLLKAAINLLYENRLDADYRPHRSVNEEASRNSLAAASLVSGMLGIRS